MGEVLRTDMGGEGIQIDFTVGEEEEEGVRTIWEDC